MAAVTDAGDLYTNDGEQPAPVKRMGGVKAVSIGQGFYLALTQCGEVYAWGDNTDGQLGNGDFGYTEDEPIRIMEDVKYIDAGRSHALAITNGGELYVWGKNLCGEIGDGTDTTRQTTPKKIMDGVATASAGAFTTAAVTESGDLCVWGYNDYGAIGNGEYRKEGSVYVTVPLKVMSGVASVSTTGSITAAITTSGELYTWGDNEFGMLGNGQRGDGDRETLDAIVPTPQKIMDDVAYVAVNDFTALAIDTAQNLYIWGQTEYGQLGDGAVGDGDPFTYDIVTTTPEMVMSDVTQAASYTYTLAVNAAGELYAWGGNASPTLITLDPNAQPVETETVSASASASVKTPFPAGSSDFSLNGCMNNGSMVAAAGVLYMPELPQRNSLLKIDLVNQTMESIGLQYSPVLAMIGVYDAYVYYMGDGQIARIKTDGSDSSRVFRAEDGQQLVGFDSNSPYIYAYTLSGEQNIVTRVDMQTDETVILSNVQKFSDAVDDSGLYFIADSAIICTDFDGNNGRTVTKIGNIMNLTVSNGWLYYVNIGNGVELYRVKTDGTRKGRVGKVLTTSYDVAGDTVYYYNATDNGKLYRIGVDGSGKKKLSDEEWISSVAVYAGRVLVSYMAVNRYDFMLPDGSDVIDMTSYLTYSP
jgi:alpha-tubulin suppressor-like RCC1 family protein